MDKPDFIKLRHNGPFEKGTQSFSYILIVISIIALFVYTSDLNINQFSIFGFTFKDIDLKLIYKLLLIALIALFLFFHSQAIPDYLNWRRDIMQADSEMKKEHLERRRGIVQRRMDDLLNNRISLTLPEEDVKLVADWEKSTWSFSKHSNIIAGFKILVFYFLPVLATIFSIIVLSLKLLIK